MALVVVAIGLVARVSSSRAQSIYSNPGTNPGAWANTTRNPLLAGNATGSTPPALFSGRLSGTANSGLIQLRANGSASNPLIGTAGEFEFVNTGTQTFTLNTASNVGLPNYLTGTLTLTDLLSDPNTTVFVNGSVVIMDAGNNVVGGVSDTFSETAAQGSVTGPAVNFDYKSVTLAAGTYTVQATLDITGHARGTPGFSSVNVDLNTASGNPRGGMETVLSASPVGVPDSRAIVMAPQARTVFGVTGAGIRVGLFEPGRPYIATDPYGGHTSLAGRITLLNTAAVAAQPGTNGTAGQAQFRSEHALATAGIIASASGNTANAGIAPGATIVACPSSTYVATAGSSASRNARNDLFASGVNVINQSSGVALPVPTDPNYAALLAATRADILNLDNTIDNTYPNVTYVKSAGNTSGDDPIDGFTPGPITSPGGAFNIITVGGLDRNMQALASYSSFGNPFTTASKPDMVAPSEYINVPAARDLTGGNGANSSFTRAFLGDTFDTPSGATVGDVSGTSFAAPHVSGTAALMDQYAAMTPLHSQDHRAIKAVMLNASNINVQHFGGGAWTQGTNGGTATPGDPLIITQSLDTQLGAGALNTYNSLSWFQSPQAGIAPPNPRGSNGPGNMTINPRPASINREFWDLNDVAAALAGGTPGTVDYLVGDLSGSHVRATLTWDRVNGNLDPLELELWHDGVASLVDGFDPNAAVNPDDLLIQTNAAGENVKLIDFTLPAYVLAPNQSDDYYFQVINASANVVRYGFAAEVPEPASLALLVMCGLLAMRRRSRPPI